jgi:hypothetical protein
MTDKHRQTDKTSTNDAGQTLQIAGAYLEQTLELADALARVRVLEQLLDDVPVAEIEACLMAMPVTSGKQASEKAWVRRWLATLRAKVAA